MLLEAWRAFEASCTSRCACGVAGAALRARLARVPAAGRCLLLPLPPGAPLTAAPCCPDLAPSPLRSRVQAGG